MPVTWPAAAWAAAISGEVMDLVPVKPLGEDEAAIRNAYRTKLTGLYQKLKG